MHTFLCWGEAVQTTSASCEALQKKEILLFFPLKWLLGFRLAAHWVQGWILRQQRGVQHLHPNHLPSPFAQLQPCNPDNKDGLRKAKPPSAQGESLPCSWLCQSLHRGRTTCPPRWVSTHQSSSFTFPLGAPVHHRTLQLTLSSPGTA